jgi:hypothetical protein
MEINLFFICFCFLLFYFVWVRVLLFLPVAFNLPPPGDLNLMDVKCKQRLVEYATQPPEIKGDDVNRIARYAMGGDGRRRRCISC